MLEVLPENGKLVAAVSAACVGGLVTGLMLASRNQKEKKPEKWIKVGTVSELIIYPVKSLQGIYVSEATATTLGLKGSGSIILRDRVFIVVDSRGVFMNQKKIPELFHVVPEVIAHDLVLTYAKDPTQRVVVNVASVCEKGATQRCRLYNDQIDGLDCGDEVGAWLSTVLKTEGLRLYYHAHEKCQRKMTPVQKRFPSFSQELMGTFHDETAYLLLSEESVQSVNNNIKEDPVTHKNFRPTILVKGLSEPFGEDVWSYTRIGNEAGPVFKTAMPCDRCSIIKIDPNTGETRKDGEPLKTLNNMRRKIGDNLVSKLVEKRPILGAHQGIFDRANMKIKVGDPVYAAVL